MRNRWPAQGATRSTAAQNISGDDLTKPAGLIHTGSRHPIAIVQREILDIFRKMGFSVEEGPEIEDDWHVFSALNFAPDHPARDMQDTFFINTDSDNPVLLRTHTSSVQVRTMENKSRPYGWSRRVFRNEAISARALHFHQVEGLYVDEKVSFADLAVHLLLFARCSEPRQRSSPSLLFSLYRTFCGSGCELQHLRWGRMQHM